MKKKLMTKSCARDIARAMVKATVKEKIKEKRQELDNFVKEVMERHFPEGTYKSICSIDQAWLFTRGNFYFKYGSLALVSIYLLKNIPFKSGKDSVIVVSKEDYDKLYDMNKVIQNMDNEDELMFKMVVETLCRLKTEKKIKEQLPECMPYIPTDFFKVSELPAVQTTELTKLLTKYK
jgi:hypothetical protein